jgi:hypothetical protein
LSWLGNTETTTTTATATAMRGPEVKNEDARWCDGDGDGGSGESKLFFG